MRKSRVSVPTDQVDIVIRDYERGTPTIELAERYGVTYPTIAYLLKKRGVAIRGRGDCNRARRKPIDIERLRHLVDESRLSQHQIADYLHVSLPVIERTLRSLGIRSKRGRGSPMEKNFFWKGGSRTEREGYVLVKCPEHPYANKAGYVREHRLVMEKKIGRHLRPEEEVHHKDDNPRNNDPDNLQLFANHAEHMRHHWLETWRAAYQTRRDDLRQQEFLTAPILPASGIDAPA